MTTRFPRGHNSRFDGTDYTLWGHRIVTIDHTARTIRLSSCGYETNTTKTHINDCLKALDSPWRVYQQHWTWYVGNYQTGEVLPFRDGMTIPGSFHEDAKAGIEKYW